MYVDYESVKSGKNINLSFLTSSICILVFSQKNSLSSVPSLKILYRGKRKLGFGSPVHLRPCFPFIGRRLWVEEASSILLRQLSFSREAFIFAFSGLFRVLSRLCPIKAYLCLSAQLTLESRRSCSIDVD